MSRVSPEQLHHYLAVDRLWKDAREKLYERFGEAPPELILTQFDADRKEWDAEDIERSAFLGRLAALAEENGWQFEVEKGFFDCLVPYLFGAIRDLPKNLDGRTHWPGDCVCTVSKELFSQLPDLFHKSFAAFYSPVQVCYEDEKENRGKEQVWTLLPKDDPLPYGAEVCGEWIPNGICYTMMMYFRLV